jgi:hypothetical protein
LRYEDIKKLSDIHYTSKFLRFSLNQQGEKLVKIRLLWVIVGFYLLGENIDYIKNAKMTFFRSADSLDCLCIP